MVETQKTVDQPSMESFDEDLKQELSELGMHGDEDGRVDCEITDVQKSGDKVTITFKPPVGEEFKKTTAAPRTKDDNSLLLDILNEKGYELVVADEIIGETVKFKRSKSSWNYTPEESLSGLKLFASYFTAAADVYEISPRAGPERMSESYRYASAIVGLPIVSLIAYIILVTGEDVDLDDYSVGLAMSCISTVFWFGIIAFFYMI